ncbi:hypothetical protein C7271_04645 [filamentous cyanobacterium CCP5]|nr:hypothetical protein C7271_04645 [filamentous cyanobacterium CCP5]
MTLVIHYFAFIDSHANQRVILAVAPNHFFWRSHYQIYGKTRLGGLPNFQCHIGIAALMGQNYQQIYV